MTYRVPGIREEIPSHFVEISQELANELGVTSGRWVRLRSPYGQVKTQVLITERVTGRELYLPLNSVTQRVNDLTGSATDKDSDTPAYKEVSVNLEVLSETGMTPLPITNQSVWTSYAAEWRRGVPQMESLRLSLTRLARRRKVGTD